MTKFGEFFRISKPKEVKKEVPTPVVHKSEPVKTKQELLDQERKEIFTKYGFEFVSSSTDALGEDSNIEHALFKYRGYDIQFRRFKDGVVLPDKWEFYGDMKTPFSVKTAEDLKNYIDDLEKEKSGKQ